MAHIYMTFDFGTDEEKAQLARHKLDGWKQAFRLDKKLLYKFERPGDGAAPDGTKQTEAAPAKEEEAKPATAVKGGKAAKGAAAKGKAQAEKVEEPREETAAPAGPVKLHLRLAFSGHEKMTEERWMKRIPAEEPFKDANPSTVKSGDAAFAETQGKFESLE